MINNSNFQINLDKDFLLDKLKTFKIKYLLPIAQYRKIKNDANMGAIVISIIFNWYLTSVYQPFQMYSLTSIIAQMIIYVISYIILRYLLRYLRILIFNRNLFEELKEAYKYINTFESNGGFLWKLIKAFNFKPSGLKESSVQKLIVQSKEGQIKDYRNYLKLFIELQRKLILNDLFETFDKLPS